MAARVWLLIAAADDMATQLTSHAAATMKLVT